MRRRAGSLRILFATPAYWPATDFGGPIPVARELTQGLVRAGHEVEVLTTSLCSIGEPAASRTRTREEHVGGVRVRYLATPLRYRWMGVTPSLPLAWPRHPRPDLVHVFGYRDVVTTMTAAWAGRSGVPYVFEPLDMFVPRYRNVPLKRSFDRLLGAPVARRAAVIVASSRHERDQLVQAGLPAARIRMRPNGFPGPAETPFGGSLRGRLGLEPNVRLVVSVGRVSFKKGLDLLLRAVAALDGVHVAIVGPDDGDGTLERLEALRRELGLGARVHLVGPADTSRPRELYGESDVFVLPSRNESFGMAAAEAASAGVPIVLTDRCGISEHLDGAAIVVPLDVQALRDALARVLGDAALRERLGEAGRGVARDLSWQAVVEQQIELYRTALETARTKASTLGS
jgi:glycosyltransferase involved in cell wall biosynthesis